MHSAMVLQHTRLIFPFLHCCHVRVLAVVCYLSLHCCCISVSVAHVTAPPDLGHHLARGVSFPVYQYRSSASIANTPDYVNAYKQQSRRILVDPASNTSSAPLALSAAPPPDTGNVPELRSDVLTLGEPFGQYFAKLQIGTPTKDIAVIIDTGSEFLWIQCNPCEHCGPQASSYPIFEPAKSSSYENVMCDADICQGDDSIAMGCTDSGACQYKVTYGDKSNSSGFVAEETLTFTIAGVAAGTATSNSSSFKLTQFVLGCGIDNVGVEAQVNASGLMGLDRGMYSIISQLGVDIFSYCLPNRVNNVVDVSGYLTFGSNATNGISSSSSSLNPSLQYTPMIQNNYSSFLSQFYYLGLTGISVNGKLLNIPAMALAIDTQTGLGGTIIDSGTTLTTFVDEAYTMIAQAFESYVDASYKKLDLANNSTRLCYEVPLSKQGGMPAAPKVTLHFAGSVDMELGADHLFHLSASDVTNNYYCLAFLSGGSVAAGAKNVIGNYQQQDFLVEYDLGNARVGFAAAHCSTTSNNGPYLLTLTKPIWYLTLTFTFIVLLL